MAPLETGIERQQQHSLRKTLRTPKASQEPSSAVTSPPKTVPKPSPSVKIPSVTTPTHRLQEAQAEPSNPQPGSRLAAAPHYVRGSVKSLGVAGPESCMVVPAPTSTISKSTRLANNKSSSMVANPRDISSTSTIPTKQLSTRGSAFGTTVGKQTISPAPKIAVKRDLWTEALQTLPQESRDLLSRLQPFSKLSILEQIVGLVEQRKLDFEERASCLEFRGRKFILRDIAGKVVAWVNKFKEVGDIIAQVDPIHVGLPWAAVRLLLQSITAESDQRGALMLGLERITFLMSRCQIYESLYLKDTKLNAAQSTLTSSLLVLYTLILEFLAKALQIFQSGTIKRTLSALSPDGLSLFLEKCKDLEGRIEADAENCQRTLSGVRWQQLVKKLEEMSQPILRIDGKVEAMSISVEDNERAEILNWISGVPHYDNYAINIEMRTPDTGNWLLQHHQFQDWRNSSASMILWLHGIPGAGKTMLVTSVLHDLMDRFGKGPSDEGLAYFYCDRNDTSRQQPLQILKSFIRQLSIREHSETIQQSVYDLYKAKQKKGFASNSLSSEECQSILLTLVQVYPQVTLVVDALDECDRDTRLDFMRNIDKLIANSARPVKVLISSRRDEDIQFRFQGGANIAIEATDNRVDITKFVASRLASSPSHWHMKLNDQLRSDIHEVIVERSAGMFQWAKLQLEQLFRLPPREKDLRARLGALPKDLESTYDEIWRDIQAVEGSAGDVAMRAFQWLMCSIDPLTPAMLVAAVCQDAETDAMESVDIDEGFLREACRNLLTIDTNAKVCRFSHLSVQEHFAKRHRSLNQAHAMVAKICLKLLCRPLQRNWTRKFAYHYMRNIDDPSTYAVLAWHKHVQYQSEILQEGVHILDPRLESLLATFLGSPLQSSRSYRSWYELVLNLDRTRIWASSRAKFLRESDPIVALRPSSQPLLAVALFRLETCLPSWFHVQTKNILDWIDENGTSLLSHSVVNNSFSVVTYLLTHKVDINYVDPSGDSAFSLAVYRGLEKMVTLLFNHGASINPPSRNEEPLSLHGRNGADISTSSGDHSQAKNAQNAIQEYSALERAILRAHERSTRSIMDLEDLSMIQFLLRTGADPNLGNPIRMTCEFGLTPIVQLLLDSGADPNQGYPMEAAYIADIPHRDVILRSLLEHGADPNLGTILERVCRLGDTQAVELLLDHGANVTIGCPLARACSSGSEELVILLLKTGALVNASDGGALSAAAAAGKANLVQLLLDEGADPQLGDPLTSACLACDHDTIRILLDRGASPLKAGSNSLRVAASKGDEEAVVLLLDAGADPNFGSESGDTALARAVKGARPDQYRIAEFLVHAGASAEGLSADVKRDLLQLLDYHDEAGILRALLFSKSSRLFKAHVEIPEPVSCETCTYKTDALRWLLEFRINPIHFSTASEYLIWMLAFNAYGIEDVVSHHGAGGNKAAYRDDNRTLFDNVIEIISSNSYGSGSPNSNRSASPSNDGAVVVNSNGRVSRSRNSDGSISPGSNEHTSTSPNDNADVLLNSNEDMPSESDDDPSFPRNSPKFLWVDKQRFCYLWADEAFVIWLLSYGLNGIVSASWSAHSFFRLTLAVAAGSLDEATAVLESGLNPNGLIPRNVLPFPAQYPELVAEKRARRTDLLIEYNRKLSPQLQSRGWLSTLSLAIRRHDIPMAALLLEHGYEVNVSFDNRCGTPLSIAVDEQDLEMMELLLLHGAEPSLRGRYADRGSALEIAEEIGWVEGEVLLLEHQLKKKRITAPKVPLLIGWH